MSEQKSQHEMRKNGIYASMPESGRERVEEKKKKLVKNPEKNDLFLWTRMKTVGVLLRFCFRFGSIVFELADEKMCDWTIDWL